MKRLDFTSVSPKNLHQMSYKHCRPDYNSITTNSSFVTGRKLRGFSWGMTSENEGWPPKVGGHPSGFKNLSKHWIYLIFIAVRSSVF